VLYFDEDALCSIALEIFTNDGRNHLMLAFPPNVLNKVYQRLLAKCTGLSDSVSQSMAGYRSGRPTWSSRPY
jgi:hypothetical protein